MKTSELTDAALDWAVAEAEGLAVVESFGPSWRSEFAPSIRWAQGGPIIEREEISIEFYRAEFKSAWIAYKLGTPHEDNPQGGNTALVAAMRCYVTSKLGEEIEIPAELLEAA